MVAVTRLLWVDQQTNYLEGTVFWTGIYKGLDVCNQGWLNIPLSGATRSGSIFPWCNQELVHVHTLVMYTFFAKCYNL